MNLGKKKALAARALKIKKDRIVFLSSRLEEIKEAITKQDIRNLKKEGAIVIKGIKGKKKKKKKSSRSPGNIRKKPDRRKKTYMIMTRKLRKYVAEVKKRGEISKEDISQIRKKIRNREFKSKAHLKEYVGVLRK